MRGTFIPGERNSLIVASHSESGQNMVHSKAHQNPSMNPDPNEAPAGPLEPPSPDPETPVGEPSHNVREGLGVFRALLLMLIFYLAAGFLLWFVWHAWRHWHAR